MDIAIPFFGMTFVFTMIGYGIALTVVVAFKLNPKAIYPLWIFFVLFLLWGSNAFDFSAY